MSDLEDLTFKSNATATIGVELELMLVDPETHDLVSTAVAIESQTRPGPLAPFVKLEITQSMLEINSSVHRESGALLGELRSISRQLVPVATNRGTRLAGGGTHPFHWWQERRISPSARFEEVAGH